VLARASTSQVDGATRHLEPENDAIVEKFVHIDGDESAARLCKLTHHSALGGLFTDSPEVDRDHTGGGQGGGDAA
jgi:hypothetical protein